MVTRVNRVDDGPRLLHPGLIAAGAALLIGALVTDIFYSQTADMQWANFSVWLITAGLILALLAGLALSSTFCWAGPGRLAGSISRLWRAQPCCRCSTCSFTAATRGRRSFRRG